MVFLKYLWAQTAFDSMPTSSREMTDAMQSDDPDSDISGWPLHRTHLPDDVGDVLHKAELCVHGDTQVPHLWHVRYLFIVHEHRNFLGLTSRFEIQSIQRSSNQDGIWFWNIAPKSIDVVRIRDCFEVNVHFHVGIRRFSTCNDCNVISELGDFDRIAPWRRKICHEDLKKGRGHSSSLRRTKIYPKFSSLFEELFKIQWILQHKIMESILIKYIYVATPCRLRHFYV